jgi:hypothetical protein
MAAGYDTICEIGFLYNGGNIIRVKIIHNVIHSINKIIFYVIVFFLLCQCFFDNSYR